MIIHEKLSVRPLSSELQKIAESELNEIPERIETDLEHIKHWLSKQIHLNCRTDNQFLLNFLRSSKYSLQKTKEKLDYHYTIKTLVPEFFTNRDPFNEEIQTILNAGVILIIPTTKNYDGPKLLLAIWRAADPQTMSYINLIKVTFMFLELLLLEDDSAAVAGVNFWAEMKGLPLGYLLQATPPIIKKFTNCIQSAFPFRMKGFYCMNTPKPAETACNLIKTFLSEKIKKRFELYSNSSKGQIFKHIPKNLVPKELGGEGDSLEDIKVASKKKLESYRKWFLEDENYRSNEELRIGTPKTTAELFGCEGSFRKLAID